MKPEEVDPKLKYNNQIAEATAHALNDGDHGLKALPGLIKITIEKKTWERRYVPHLDETVECASFKEYITKKPWEGLGADPDVIRRLCRGDEELETALELALQGKQGPPMGNQNAAKSKTKPVNNKVCFDNDRPYALRRLSKDRPDLHARVIEKKLSPHA